MSVIIMKHKIHGQFFKNVRSEQIHHSDSQEGFQPLVQIYQSQKGQSSLPKGNQAHSHILHVHTMFGPLG